MGLFRSRAEKELDSIIYELKCNLENNYKDVAHDARKRLGERCEALYAEGAINETLYRKYKRVYEEYTQMMKGYHH